MGYSFPPRIFMVVSCGILVVPIDKDTVQPLLAGRPE
jgi:hypothetical protein